MIGVPFQVQRIVQPAQHLGLAGAGHAAQHQEIAFGDGPVQRIQQEAAHGLVAAGHARIGDAGLVAQPLLHDLRTQAAPEAIQVAVRMRLRERGPGVETGRLDGAADQPVPQLDGGLLATLLVADADQLALFVGHQRQIHHAGKRALGELDGRAGVHHGHVVEEEIAVVAGVCAHGRQTARDDAGGQGNQGILNQTPDPPLRRASLSAAGPQPPRARAQARSACPPPAVPACRSSRSGRRSPACGRARASCCRAGAGCRSPPACGPPRAPCHPER